MNLRWLFGNFAEPAHGLSHKRGHELSNRATQKHLSGRSLAVYTLLVIVLPFAAVYVLIFPLIMDWLGYARDNTAHLIGLGVVILLFWIYSAWMYRYLYVKPMRRALRDAGVDLCIACGYELTNLPEDRDRCPECGAKREPLAEHTESKSPINADEDG